MKTQIEVKEITDLHFAAVTCEGTQELGSAFGKIIQWATSKGVMVSDAKLLTVFHDSFKDKPSNKVRMSVGVVVVDIDGGDSSVNWQTIQGGKYIVGHSEIGMDEFQETWTGLFAWMNEQGLKKGSADPFEIYHNDYNEHPEKKCIVDMYIPLM